MRSCLSHPNAGREGAQASRLRVPGINTLSAARRSDAEEKLLGEFTIASLPAPSQAGRLRSYNAV